MTRRDLGLLVLILLLGASVTFVQHVRKGSFPFEVEIDGVDILQGPSHTFNEIREADLAPGGKVQIDAVRGEVEVLTWSEPRVRVEVRKQVRAGSEEEAARVSGGLPLELTPAGTGLTVRLTAQPGVERPGGLVSDFTVMLPRQSRLLVSTSHGGVRVHGLSGDVVIRTSFGDVEAGELGGACEVANRHGSVTVSRVAGPVRINTSHDDVKASDVGGAVQIDLTHGSLNLADTRGQVDVRCRHGEVRIARSAGDVRLDAPYSSVTVEAVGAGVKAKVEADPVELRDVKGPAEIQAEATSVRLVDVQGRIQVTGRHTDVEVVHPGGDVLVQTSHQEIVLTPPAGRGFRLRARTELGEIRSDLPGLKIPAGMVANFAGVLGDARSTYDLSTSHSVIRIRSPQTTTSSGL